MMYVTPRSKESCAHSWRLWLHPSAPHHVAVVCFYCRTSLNDIWPGATLWIHMQMGDFTVTDGTHTAQRIVNMPIDVFIKDSQQFTRDEGFSSRLEVNVIPQTTGIGGVICNAEGPPFFSHSPDIRCILETHEPGTHHSDGTVTWLQAKEGTL